MTYRWIGSTWAACALAAGLACAAGGAAAQEFKIRYASPSAASDPSQAQIVWFAEEMEKRTNGRVKFELFLGNALVKDQDVLNAVRDGLVEMAKIYTVSYPGQLPLFNIGNLPFTHGAPYVSMMTMHALREQFPEFVQETDRLKVEVLGVLSTGGTQLVSKKPLRTLADLKGMKIRARGVQALAITAASATPLSTPWNDVYEALSKGVVEASTNYIMAVGPIRHNEVSDYFVYVDLGQAVQAEIVNKDYWNALPADIKELMRKTMREAEIRYVEATAKIAVDEVARLSKASGSEKLEFIRFPAEERKKWIDGGPDFFAKWADENKARGKTAEIAKAFSDLEKKYAAEGEKLGYTQMW